MRKMSELNNNDLNLIIDSLNQRKQDLIIRFTSIDIHKAIDDSFRLGQLVEVFEAMKK